jgi:general stress protein CsbA
MGAKKLEGIDINSWKEVADFAKSAGVSAKELYNYTIKKFRIKTDIMTMAIGCLVYDTLKKKSKLSTRSRIINLRKNIEVINPKYKMFSDKQLYENANHALNRTPDFVKWDKKVRKRIF